MTIHVKQAIIQYKVKTHTDKSRTPAQVSNQIE